MPRRRTKVIAWTLSVAFHAALALLLLRDDTGGVRTLPEQPEGLTREAASDDDPAFTFAVASPVVERAPTGRRPAVFKWPQGSLPGKLENLPPREERVEVQDVTPIDFRTPVEAAKPAVEPTPVAKLPFGRGEPLHGPLPVGKSVVYLLDRSTSMGLTRETFDAARAATLASVLALPGDARFGVIAYGGAAVRLLPGQGLLKKSDAHGELLTEALRDLKPEGESRHDRALRAALPLGADMLVFITDAGADELADLRPILKGHGKPVAVSVVRVAAGKVSGPVALR